VVNRGGIETRVMNQSVTRNIERFPDDFMFELKREEIVRISQIVIPSAFSASSARDKRSRFQMDWSKIVTPNWVAI